MADAKKISSVFDISGKQYTVNEGDVIAVDKLDKNPEDKIEFTNVLLVNDNGDIKIGSPYVQGAKIEAKVIEQTRDEKVIVFKYKKKKRYKRMRGHKQHFTMIKIEKIVA